MHIRDGILAPEVCLATAVLSIGAVSYSLRRLRLELDHKAVPLTGMMAALVFAGQMVNFPLIGLPVSGHLLGGVLASVILGPWAGCLAIAMVLVVQAILFSDGGLMSLGANVLNMGVVGAWGGYAVYCSLRKLLGTKTTATITSAAVAAWLSVLAAAALFCFEFAASSRSTTFDLRNVFGLMVFFHALIGLGEALITAGVIAFVLNRRADLIPQPAVGTVTSSVGRFVVAGLVASLAVAAIMAPFKSNHPDGLDAVSQTTGLAELQIERKPIALSEYSIPVPFSQSWPGADVALAGIFGTTVVFLGALVVAYLSRWKTVPIPVDNRAVSHPASGMTNVERRNPN